MLTGANPSTLFLLSQLTYLRLSGNSLSGSVPSFVSSMSSLVHLHLRRNLLTGMLPTTLGVMGLGYLDLSCNYLSGSIPNTLSKPQTLIVSYNMLTGPVPAALTATNLQENHNRFTSFTSSYCSSSQVYQPICNYCGGYSASAGCCSWSTGCFGYSNYGYSWGYCDSFDDIRRSAAG